MITHLSIQNYDMQLWYDIKRRRRQMKFKRTQKKIIINALITPENHFL